LTKNDASTPQVYIFWGFRFFGLKNNEPSCLKMSPETPTKKLMKRHLIKRISDRFSERKLILPEIYRTNIASAILFLLIFSGAAAAQVGVETATLKGTITDPNGAVVPNAAVQVVNAARGTTRDAVTDENGIYQIPSLQPGVFTLKITADGFTTVTVQNIELSIGQSVVRDVQLKIEGGAATVDIVSGEGAIEIARTQQSNTISRRQIENLPNIGRDFTSYVFTLPGVTDSNVVRAQYPQADGAFTTSGFSIGGGNGRNNLITIDGGENELGSGQLRVRNLSPEAVQEFQVNRNSFAAEFGFTSGSAVNVITRGGANDFHGSAYIYYRSQRFNARNFFDTTAEKPYDQRVSPGATFGGRLIRNKLFFFTSYEGLKADTARFRSYTSDPSLSLNAPTAAQVSYINLLTASADPNLQRIGANLRRDLTTTNFPATLSYLNANEGFAIAPVRSTNSTTRFDFQATKNDLITGRFTFSDDTRDTLGSNNDQAPTNGVISKIKDYTILTAWTHIFNPRLINETRVQIVPRSSVQTLSRDPGATSFNLPGIATFGRNTATPLYINADRFQFDNALTWTLGRHTLKAGASFRPISYRLQNDIFFGGLWTFSGGVITPAQAVPSADRAALTAFNQANNIPANGPAAASLTALQTFNLGLPRQWQQSFNNSKLNAKVNLFGAYVQDSFNVRRGLTIDAGVRFDYEGEPEPLGKHSYLSPRLGFAWDIFGDQKTVLRGGAGVFIAPILLMTPLRGILQDDSGEYINQIITTSSDGARSPILLWRYGVNLGALPNRPLTEAEVNAFGISTGPRSLNRRINTISSDYRNSNAAQFSLGLSRQITPDLNIEVGYVFYRTLHIQQSVNANYRESGVVDPLFGPQLVRIDPTITQNNLYNSIGSSNYNAGTLSVNKRFSHNFQAQFNYTFAKAIDDVTDFNALFFSYIPTRLNLDRSVSTFDIRHNFVASGTFQTPWTRGKADGFVENLLADVSISPIISYHTALPFNGRVGRDVNGDTAANNDRPFAEGRNTGRGGDYFNVNLRVEKGFKFSADSNKRLNFIVETTNLFNRTNFLSVNDVIGSDPELLRGPYNFRGDKSKLPTAPLGFTSAADARQIQFGLKFIF
jgi:hypothetical protein